MPLKNFLFAFDLFLKPVNQIFEVLVRLQLCLQCLHFRLENLQLDIQLFVDPLLLSNCLPESSVLFLEVTHFLRLLLQLSVEVLNQVVLPLQGFAEVFVCSDEVALSLFLQLDKALVLLRVCFLR